MDRIAQIENALARLEVKTSHLEGATAKILENQESNHRFLHRILNGSSNNEFPGLRVRVDRLEGWRKRQTKFVTTLFTVVVPLFSVRIWEIFAGGR